jgi:tungstate transport system substrate-binding protein
MRAGELHRRRLDPLYQDSGLFGYLLALFKAKTGIDVKVVGQGTGQALDTARRGDADVVFVHARAAEEKFMAEGLGVKRFPVMYNDSILIGPVPDPAGIRRTADIVAALKATRDKPAPFVSRGDRSGNPSGRACRVGGRRRRPRQRRGPLVSRDRVGDGLNTAGAMGA